MSRRSRVESDANRGSVFHFTARFGLQKQQGKKGYLQGGGSDSARLGSRRPVREGRQELRILLVEDNATNQILAQRLVRKRGPRSVTSNDTEELCAGERTIRFDLDGHPDAGNEQDQVTAEIRRKEKITGEHIPIVATTASAMKRTGSAAWKPEWMLSPYPSQPN